MSLFLKYLFWEDRKNINNITSIISKIICSFTQEVWYKLHFSFDQLSYAFDLCMHHMSDLPINVHKATLQVLALT